MPYTVEYGLKKYIEIMNRDYSGTIADMLKFDVVSCDEVHDNYVLKCRTEPSTAVSALPLWTRPWACSAAA